MSLTIPPSEQGRPTSFRRRAWVVGVLVVLTGLAVYGLAVRFAPDTWAFTGGQNREGTGTDDEAERKIAAPELEGGVGWLNTASPLRLKDLRGKFVLLDFWTFCCINCIHTLPDLAKLEKKYANQLVVIGVHSAKFENEKESEHIRKAILRYEISHPVVNDAEMKIWQTYGVSSWPTLYLID